MLLAAHLGGAKLTTYHRSLQEVRGLGAQWSMVLLWVHNQICKEGVVENDQGVDGKMANISGAVRQSV